MKRITIQKSIVAVAAGLALIASASAQDAEKNLATWAKETEAKVKELMGVAN